MFVIADNVTERRKLLVTGRQVHTDEYNAVGVERQSNHEFTEILVLRQEDTPLLECKLKNLFVRDSRRNFKDVPDIVPIGPQASDDAGITTFVGHELHSMPAVVSTNSSLAT